MAYHGRVKRVYRIKKDLMDIYVLKGGFMILDSTLFNFILRNFILSSRWFCILVNFTLSLMAPWGCKPHTHGVGPS